MEATSLENAHLERKLRESCDINKKDDEQISKMKSQVNNHFILHAKNILSRSLRARNLLSLKF